LGRTEVGVVANKNSFKRNGGFYVKKDKSVTYTFSGWLRFVKKLSDEETHNLSYDVKKYMRLSKQYEKYLEEKTKEFEELQKQEKLRKLKVYGLTIFCKKEHIDSSQSWRTQCRYVAAVKSRRELAELANTKVSSWEIVNSSVTSNKREIELAMANPHTLVFSEVR